MATVRALSMPAKHSPVARSVSLCVALVFCAWVYVIAEAPRAEARSNAQVVTLQAATGHSRTAVLRTWALESDGHYVQVFAPFIAYVGENGIGPTREGLGRTPSGVFTLTRAFGNQPNNGTKLPYVLAGADDWWDENPASPTYNRLVKDSVSPGGNSENLYDAGHPYSHAVVINYNTNPVIKGAGSGFFIHVSYGAPTEGCVAIRAAQLDLLMRWLLPANHPVISIGIGAAALAPVRPSS